MSSYGLELYAADGSVILNSTQRVVKFVALVSLNDGSTSSAAPYVYTIPSDAYAYGREVVATLISSSAEVNSPHLEVSGNTIRIWKQFDGQTRTWYGNLLVGMF